METDAAAAMAMIPAGSLSYCSCSVVDVAITVVAADIFGRQRLFPLPFLCSHLWKKASGAEKLSLLSGLHLFSRLLPSHLSHNPDY